MVHLPGAWNDEFEKAKGRVFADSLLRHELRAKAGRLRMITVDGDSMEPRSLSRDRILFDASRTAPVPLGIFVIWDGNGSRREADRHLPNSDPAAVVLKSLTPSTTATSDSPRKSAS